MEPRKPVIGGKYCHFKNKMHQLLAVATHSEDEEKYIVYQALYDEFRVYIRPLRHVFERSRPCEIP